MKVTTGPRAYPLLLNVAFALFCLGGALWGAYDYWIAYPAIERANVELSEAKEVISKLSAAVETREQARGAAPSLAPPVEITPEDLKRYEAAQETIRRITAEFGGEPRQLAAWDRPLQLWLWVIGCGVLGFPFFIRPIYRILTRKWELDERGTLRTPDETIPLDSVTGIDMNRWCSATGSKRSTWKAWLLTKDGKRHELDDHDYRDMHRIIGFYAHRFHPEDWTLEAKRVKPESDAAADSTNAKAAGDASETAAATGSDND